MQLQIDYYPFGSPLYGRSLTREECTEVTTVTPVTDLNNTFTGNTESYTAYANTTLTVVSNELTIEKTSGNVKIGATKSFTITQSGSNHKVEFKLNIPTTLGTSVVCLIDNTTVTTVSATGATTHSITLPNSLATGNYTLKFETLNNVSGNNKYFTIDNVKVFYDVTTVTTTCNQILSIGDYRYGFNGKEMDNEVKGKGNQQDYGMRIYDNRLGRFLSIDPITKNYPMLTPYQFASNRPIDGIDLDGLEWMEAQLFTAVSIWYVKLKGGTAKMVEAATNTGNYNHETVPKSIQNKLRLIEAGQGATAVKESIVEAGEFAAETFNTIPGVEVLGDPLLAAYYAKKGDYESSLAYSAASGLPLASGFLFKRGAKELKNVFTPETTQKLKDLLNLGKKDDIHSVKKTILNEHDHLIKKNKTFGNNPDVGVDKSTGNVTLESRQTGDVIITDTPIEVYKKVE